MGSRGKVIPAMIAAALVAGCVAPAAAPGQTCYTVDGRADRHCTPGALNHGVTQSNIQSTICRHGWTATVRPSSSFTTRLKNEQKILYGEANVSNSELEEDHQLPLGIGGDPRSKFNLWPQPIRFARVKDRMENGLRVAVCNGRMTLADAQQTMLREWTR